MLGKDEETASATLGDALAVAREAWEPETTARNLRLIREVRERRGGAVLWASVIQRDLMRKSGN